MRVIELLIASFLAVLWARESLAAGAFEVAADSENGAAAQEPPEDAPKEEVFELKGVYVQLTGGIRGGYGRFEYTAREAASSMRFSDQTAIIGPSMRLTLGFLPSARWVLGVESSFGVDYQRLDIDTSTVELALWGEIGGLGAWFYRSDSFVLASAGFKHSGFIVTEDEVNAIEVSSVSGPYAAIASGYVAPSGFSIVFRLEGSIGSESHALDEARFLSGGLGVQLGRTW